MTTLSSPALLDALAALVGPHHAHVATDADAVDGVSPRAVVVPGSIDDVAAVLRLAHAHDLALAPRGGGTALGLGAPPSRLDIVLSLGRLDRVLEHAAGDLVVRAEAGTPLARVKAVVAEAGQTLALDPPEEARGATLGGIVAADLSGPRRLRYGTTRDLLIGLTVVQADGTVAHAGGRVVKNVAGYDLCKLFTRSLGTVGVVVETIFRLHPAPPARGLVTASFTSPAALHEGVQAVLRSTLTPSALEMRWTGGHGRLGLLFEGGAAGVAAQVERAALLWSAQRDTTIVSEAHLDAVWGELTQRPWDDASDEQTVGLKIAVPIAHLPRLLEDAVELEQRYGATIALSGHAGSGVVFAALRGVTDPIAATAIEQWRAWVVARGGGGSVVLMQGSQGLKRSLDVWGPVGDALPVMRAIKQRFDPRGILNPGRYVGGL